MEYYLDIQFFGTGRSKAGGGGSGGGSNTNQAQGPSNANTLALRHYQDKNPAEVADIMSVLKNVEDEYGVTVSNAMVSTTRSNYLGMYDGGGNLHINEKYFDKEAMDKSYDQCVAHDHYHPERGDKSGMEAVVAHEMGHRLNHYAAGESWYALDIVAGEIVKNAAKSFKMGNKTKQFARKISGYAMHDASECVAEAFSDVYCNGSKAARESIAVVNELKARVNERRSIYG